MTGLALLNRSPGSPRAFHFRRGCQRSAYKTSLPLGHPVQPGARPPLTSARERPHTASDTTTGSHQGLSSLRAPASAASPRLPQSRMPQNADRSSTPGSVYVPGRPRLPPRPSRKKAAASAPRQASGLFASERAATTQRPDSGARAPQHSPAPGPLMPQGLVSARVTHHALVEALHLVPRAQPLWSPPLRLPRPVPAGGAAVDAEWQAWGSAYNPLTQPRGPPHICVRQAPG